MKKHPVVFLMLLLLPLLGFGFSCWALEPLEAQAQMSLTAAGSGVNLGITRLLANEFSKYNKEVTIEVPGSIGTRGAIKAAADGAIALGLISRSLKEEEKALGLIAHPYARVAIVIAANPTVGDDNITTNELNEVFKGTKTRWKDGSQIIVQAREKSDSGFLVLENNIPGFKEIYAESHAAKRWTLYFNDQDANRAIASTSYAVGVTDLGMIATEHLNVRVLKLNGIAPDRENVLKGSYPLSRQLSFIYRSGMLAAEAKAFMEFTASETGRSILQANGYIPLP